MKKKLKRKHKIIIVLLFLAVAIPNFILLAFYLRHEGQYQTDGSDYVYELKNGKFIVNGKEEGAYTYSFFARKLYVKKNEGLLVFGDKWPVWIYWNHIEMPDIKGGRTKHRRISPRKFLTMEEKHEDREEGISLKGFSETWLAAANEEGRFDLIENTPECLSSLQKELFEMDEQSLIKILGEPYRKRKSQKEKTFVYCLRDGITTYTLNVVFDNQGTTIEKVLFYD